MYFFDSSSYFKLFVAEPGSREMIALVESCESGDQAVSALTVLEVRSAIRRRERMGDILAADAALAVTSFQLEAALILEYAITPSVLAKASRLVDRHVLRALDAIQLATAIVARDDSRPSLEVSFVAADAKLLTAAAAEGLITWNPVSRTDFS